MLESMMELDYLFINSAGFLQCKTKLACWVSNALAYHDQYFVLVVKKSSDTSKHDGAGLFFINSAGFLQCKTKLAGWVSYMVWFICLDNAICVFTQAASNVTKTFQHGILTKGDGSVRLTSSLR